MCIYKHTTLDSYQCLFLSLSFILSHTHRYYKFRYEHVCLWIYINAYNHLVLLYIVKYATNWIIFLKHKIYVARSIVALPIRQELTVRMTICRGALMQPPSSTRDEEKDYQEWSAWGGKVADLSREKGLEPFSPWAFIRFIGMQIKLINHCQPARIKQYKIYRELPGLSLSYSQSARGP